MILEQYDSAAPHASYLIDDEHTMTAVVADPQSDVDQFVDAARAKGLAIPNRTAHPSAKPTPQLLGDSPQTELQLQMKADAQFRSSVHTGSSNAAGETMKVIA